MDFIQRIRRGILLGLVDEHALPETTIRRFLDKTVQICILSVTERIISSILATHHSSSGFDCTSRHCKCSFPRDGRCLSTKHGLASSGHHLVLDAKTHDRLDRLSPVPIAHAELSVDDPQTQATSKEPGPSALSLQLSCPVHG